MKQTQDLLLKNKFLAIFIRSTLAVWGLLSLMAAFYYPGKLFYFTSFCLISILMFVFAWVGRKSYFYIYLSSIFLLGFWMKTVLHLIIGYDFVEPIGYFDGSGEAWDKVLNISMLAELALILARIVYLKFFKDDSFSKIHQLSKAPVWYKSYAKIFWIISLLSILVLVIVNSVFRIQLTGLAPLHHLPFKLNAIIAWLLATAIISWIFCLIWWKLCLKKSISFYCVLAVAFVSSSISISTISRGSILFQFLPFLLSLIFLYKPLRLNYTKLSLYFLIFLVSTCLTITAVSYQRAKLFKLEKESIFHIALGLVTDRWLGLEGVMAISSWPNVGEKLFFQAITEKQSVSNAPIYSQISDPLRKKTLYLNSFNGKFVFGSMPGVVGFLYYSGSLWIVMFSMFSISIIIFLTEKIIGILLRNPFILSFYGFYSALIFSQMLSFNEAALQFFEMLLGIFVLWLIQEKISFPMFQKAVKIHALK